LHRNPSEVVKDHYAHIANYSLDRMEPADRALYAEWVAPEPTLPHAVAKRLAGDEEIAVAHMVLKLSPVLTDDDLAGIALTHSQEHLIAIAERAALAEIATEILIDRGSDTVLRVLSGNEGARFSERGLSRLEEKAGTNPQIAQNLAGRRSAERQSQRVLRIAVQAADGGSATTTAEARQRREEVRTLIEDVHQRKRTLDDVVAMLADQDRAFDLALVIGSFAKLPAAQVLKTLLASDVDGIAIVCRSLSLPPETFRHILQLRLARLKQEQRQYERDLEAYEDLPVDVSQEIIQLFEARAARR
jgi:uncharacterized protein (DUF2336 family)